MKRLFLQKARTIIFPRGNVHEKYLSYVGWSCFSNIIASAENVMSTHSILSVLGNTSTELTLSTNFISKDLVGQLGALYYMNKMGNKSDNDPKKFIKYSLILQQSSIFLDSMTPLLPLGVFIPIAGLSNIMMNISFTGFGAVNTKVITKLAKDDNVGEIYSKLSVINTLGSSLGMVLGMGIVSVMPDHNTRLFILPVLTMIRVYSYKKAIEGLI